MKSKPSIDILLARATPVHEPESAPLMGMLLERAGHDLGHAAHAGTKVLDARVVEGNVLVVQMAAPHLGGFELMGVARRLMPDSPTVAVSLGIERYVTPGAALLDAERWRAAPVWQKLIDRVGAGMWPAAAPEGRRPTAH